MIVELNVFLCDMKDVEKMDVKEGKHATLRIEEAFDLNISQIDKAVLKEIYNNLRNS